MDCQGNCITCPNDVVATCEFMQAVDNEINEIVRVMRERDVDPMLAKAILTSRPN